MTRLLNFPTTVMNLVFLFRINNWAPFQKQHGQVHWPSSHTGRPILHYIKDPLLSDYAWFDQLANPLSLGL